MVGPATFTERLTAFLIDYLLILLYLIMLFVFGFFLFPSIQQLFTGSLYRAQFFGFLFVTLPVSVYYIIMDSNIVKCSVGKRLRKIRVVNQFGQSPNLLQSAARTFLKFIPWEMSHFLVYRLVSIGENVVPIRYYVIGGYIYLLIFIYIFTAIFSKRKRSLYDMLSNTYVIRRLD
ncbi:RDD family protein [Paenibacillus sediminis]|uniref:RDD family membrane protein YckC n=1 Tax=Paenibacillus sediminis TaxID=664909 RepID=A0ABS4H245_9BACL|nr:RDD family protein [Paenibacillus sediminis]MBP1936551.1 putative RDD family membrane protein YckC [Paenibacillus sediminis]